MFKYLSLSDNVYWDTTAFVYYTCTIIALLSILEAILFVLLLPVLAHLKFQGLVSPAPPPSS